MIDHLRTRAAATPLAPALWHRARGQWRGWQWQDVLSDVAALAGALALAPGERLLLQSAARPESLIALLACRWRGAIAIATPTSAFAHAIVETAEHADALRAAGHAGPITLIDPPPGAASPTALSSLATLSGLAALIANAPAPSAPIATEPDTTPHAPPMHGFCQVPPDNPAEFRANAAPLLRDGGTLTFPERPDTVSTDLLEARPERFSATAAQWHALHERLSAQLPAQRLAWPFAAARLKRHLGLERSRLRIAHGAPLAPATAAFFARLGLDLTELAP